MPVLNQWTPALRARFLNFLSARGDVRAAAVACGLSRQSAYKLRRRDPEFAGAWNAALARRRRTVEARPTGSQTAPGWIAWLGEDGPRGDRAREFLRLLAAVAGVTGVPVDTFPAESLPRIPSTPSTVSTVAAHRTHSSPISS